MKNLTVKSTKKYLNSTKKELTSTILSLEEKFESNFNNKLLVRLHSSRKNFDRQLGRKTPDWLVGNTNKNVIDILDPNAFEKESSHPKSDFTPILKHELTHIFIRISAPNKDIPLWLNEGLAMHFANQVKNYKKEGLQVEKDFLHKIATQNGWNKYANGEAYRFSALFLNYLIKEYSLKKSLDLLKSLNKNYSRKSFDLKFKKIFGVSLLEAENDFLKNISQQ
jgi:hypothetical protein